jgi:hypothetical protein
MCADSLSSRGTSVRILKQPKAKIMNNREILEKAVRKAIDGGWQQGIVWMDALMSHPDKFNNHETYSGLIFNHDFAKALWGKKNAGIDLIDAIEAHHSFEISNWRKHLMHMVIAKDPIAYLREHVDG